MSWTPLAGPLHGSESGTVELDEEHDCGARITLERDAKTAPYAITCGIYGWMVHTRYFEDRDTAHLQYDAMKAGLAHILSLIPEEGDVDFNGKLNSANAAISGFVERFPT
jgi:hypothetical protein